MKTYTKFIFIIIFFLFFHIEANAYIGPGMSGGALIAVLGFILAILAGLFGLIYFPIKKFIKKMKNKKTNIENISNKK